MVCLSTGPAGIRSTSLATKGGTNCVHELIGPEGGLQELWTLKWHQNCNTAGTWTEAKGVQPEDWLTRIRKFGDY